jgi:hypothetical protein
MVIEPRAGGASRPVKPRRSARAYRRVIATLGEATIFFLDVALATRHVQIAGRRVSAGLRCSATLPKGMEACPNTQAGDEQDSADQLAARPQRADLPLDS